MRFLTKERSVCLGVRLVPVIQTGGDLNRWLTIICSKIPQIVHDPGWLFSHHQSHAIVQVVYILTNFEHHCLGLARCFSVAPLCMWACIWWMVVGLT